MTRDEPLTLVQHLALYTAFHRTCSNRIAHAVLVPVVLFSAMCIEAYVRVPGGGSLMHLATLLSLVVTLVLATIDVLGAMALGAVLFVGSWAAGLVATGSPWLVVPIASLVHAAAWYGTVVIGHEHIEAPIATDAGHEDSNLYFRRGYYLGRGLGVAVCARDALVQFCVAPLAVVQEVLVMMGLRTTLEAAIDAERARVHARLACGAAPLGGSQ